jgi:hypothetical protein
MSASQQNGHDFDNEVKTIFNVTGNGYTSTHDIPAQFNDGIDASIKSSVGDTCDCGDALRMFNNSMLEQYQMIRGRFEQVGTQKHLREVHLLNLALSRELLWGSITLEEVIRLNELTKTFRPGKEDIRKEVHKLKKELNAKSGFMQFRPKMDSKQHRLQCSIPKWSKLVQKHEDRVIYHTTNGMFKGTQLTLVRESGRRIRRERH